SDGCFEANRIGNERPDVGMRLQDERNAFDRGSVSAFAALGEALLDEGLRVIQQFDALTGGALAAEVVGEAFAIRRLPKHSRGREFPRRLGSGEEQGLLDAVGTQRAAQCGDDARITEEFREAHQQPPLPASETRVGSTADRISTAISSAGRIAFAAVSKHWTV